MSKATCDETGFKNKNWADIYSPIVNISQKLRALLKFQTKSFFMTSIIAWRKYNADYLFAQRILNVLPEGSSFYYSQPEDAPEA